MWEFKSSTDLYEFKKVCVSRYCNRVIIPRKLNVLLKSKSLPMSISFSPYGSHFLTTSLSTDRQVRIFAFLTGKLHRKYDESLAAVQEMQQAGTAVYRMDEMEFGRRLAIERELEKSEASKREKGVWDESGNFVLYPTLLGIKGSFSFLFCLCQTRSSRAKVFPCWIGTVVNTVTNKVARVLGKDETNRFLDLSMYQGVPLKKGFKTIVRGTFSLVECFRGGRSL
jgi:peptidylprolyl isomerase domain and WD repeat-containing protein 1